MNDGTLGLVDTVSTSINKAVAIVSMMMNRVAADEDEISLSADEHYYALQAVQHELLDVGTIVEAYHQNTNRQRA